MVRRGAGYASGCAAPTALASPGGRALPSLRFGGPGHGLRLEFPYSAGSPSLLRAVCTPTLPWPAAAPQQGRPIKRYWIDHLREEELALLEEELLPAWSSSVSRRRDRMPPSSCSGSRPARSAAQPEAAGRWPGAPLAFTAPEVGHRGPPPQASTLPWRCLSAEPRMPKRSHSGGEVRAAVFRMVCGGARANASGFAPCSPHDCPSRSWRSFAPSATTNPAPFQAKSSRASQRKGSPQPSSPHGERASHPGAAGMATGVPHHVQL